MQEIAPETKKQVKTYLNAAKVHIKEAEQILNGWSKSDRWPSRPKFELNEALYQASQEIWKAQECIFGTKADATES